MQDGLRPFPTRLERQLEYRPGVVRAVCAFGAVKVAGAVEDQLAEGIGRSGVPEIVEYLFRPASAGFGRQLEDGPAEFSAAHGSRAVEIAGGIEDHGGEWKISVLAFGVEAVEEDLLPASAGFRRQLEDGTETGS